jgi:trimeric autotransporter adhesin
VDYNSSTGSFTHWTSISYPNAEAGSDAVTHIEGISSVKPGVYTLSGDSYLSDSFSTGQGLFVTIRRNPNGTFGGPRFVKINYTNATDITSANSVYGNQVVGIVVGDNPPPYQATVQK